VSSSKLKYYELEVMLPGQGALRTLLQASSPTAARARALQLHPGSAVRRVAEYEKRLSPLPASSPSQGYKQRLKAKVRARQQQFNPPKGKDAFANLQTAN